MADFLAGFQTGMNAVAEAQQLRTNALNMTQRIMAMDQQKQMFPLEMQQLSNRNQIESLNIQSANQAMQAQHEDDVAWADWHTKHTNAIDLLTSPPTAGTIEGMKRIAEAQKIVGDTVAGMELVAQQQAKNPLIQSQIEAHKASTAASIAREKYYQTRPNPGDKDYGEIQIEDIVPGYKAVYRKGSPGLHLVKTDGTSVTVKDRVNLAAKISTIRKQMDDLDKSSQTYKDLDAIVQAAQAEMKGMPQQTVAPSESPRIANPPDAKDPLGLFP